MEPEKPAPPTEASLPETETIAIEDDTMPTPGLKNGSLEANSAVVKTEEGGGATVAAAELPSNIAPPDSAYGWLIVFASFMCHFAMFGTNWSFGVFQRYYTSHDVFSPEWPPPTTPGGTASQTIISVIGSLQNFSLFFFAPITGRLADRYGYQAMMLIGALLMVAGNVGASFVTGDLGRSAGLTGLALLQGVMYGTGMSSAFPPVIAAPTSWFAKRRGLAVGIAVAGTGLGGFAIGPLTQLMIDTIGWRWALRVLGLFPGVVVTAFSPIMRSRLKPRVPGTAWFSCFACFGRSKRKEEKKKDADSKVLHLEFFKDVTFSLLFTGAFIWTLAMMNVWLYISPFAASEGYNASQGALLVGILNGASAFGRVFLGLTADFFGPLNSLILCITGTILSTWILWPISWALPNPSSFPVMVVFGVLYGAFGGGFVSLVPTSLASIYGVAGLATRLGMFFFCYPISGLLSGPFGGLIIDANTTYNPDGTKNSNFLSLIIYTAAVLTLGAVFFYTVRILRARDKSLTSRKM